MSARLGIDLDVQTLLKMRAEHPKTERSRFAGANAAGGKTGRHRGAGVDLYDLRGFVDGDDIRHVDANASARTGKLHIKTYVEEKDVSALLVVDLRSSMYWGTATCLRAYAAVCSAAKTGWQIANIGGRVSFLVIEDEGFKELSALDGDAGMTTHCQHLTAIYNEELKRASTEKPNLSMALLRARELTSRQTGVIVHTGLDDLGENFRESLIALQNRDCRFVIIEDRIEHSALAYSLPVIGNNGHIEYVKFTGEKPAAIAIFDEFQIPYQRILSEEVMA